MIYIETIEEYNDMLSYIEEVVSNSAEIDFETTELDIRTLTPILLGVCYDREEFIINLLKIKNISKLFELLKNKLIIAHNAKFEYSILKWHYNIELENIWCTQLCSQIISNGTDLSNSYEACLERGFDIKVNKAIRNTFINRDLNLPITTDEKEYLCSDIRYLKQLKERQEKIGKERELLNCFKLENEYIPVCADMELEGIKVNVNKWKENTKLYKQKSVEEEKLAKESLTRIDADFPNLFKEKFLPNKNRIEMEKVQATLFDKYAYTNKRAIINNFNINSSTQIKEIFRRCYLNLESTDEGNLNSFVLNNKEHKLIPFVTHLLNIREYNKLVSTYGNNFLSNIHPVTNKIHTSYSQCFTDTGRLSSNTPNMQNIPARQEIRSCFIPDDDNHIFVDVDLGGQELRIVASYSKDKLLTQSFSDNLDLHSVLAQSSHRIVKNNPNFIVSKTENKNLRDEHKPVLFGYLYGAGPKRIADILNIPRSTAQQVYNKLKENLNGLTNYQNRLRQAVVKNKEVRCGSYINRVRYFNTLVDVNLEDYEIEKQGINFPIQSTGASMIKEAGIKIRKYSKENNNEIKIKLQIHDEYLIQIPKNKLYHADKIKEIMEEVGSKYLTGLKMESEMKIAEYWSK